MKKNDLYKVINNLESALPYGKGPGKILSYLMFLLLSQGVQSQVKQSDSVVVNKGILKIKDSTQLAAFFDFENENTGKLNNDGEFYIYKNWNNDGFVGFTNDTIIKSKFSVRSNGVTYFHDTPRVLAPKQLITGSKISNFQNVEFNNRNDITPFDLKTAIKIGNNSDFQLGIINALNNGRVIFDTNATYSNAGEISFVDGIVEKTGDSKFEYPVGNNLYFRPSLSASSGDNSYTSQYFFQKTFDLYPQSEKDDKSILTINNAEQWRITQTDGTDHIVLSLTTDSKTTPSEFFNLLPDTELAIVRWDVREERWINEGGKSEDATNKSYSGLVMGEVKGYGIFTIAIVNKKDDDRADVIVYNAISPNDDGINDSFHIKGIDNFPDNTVEIYNRWGVKVYDAKSYNETDVMFRGYSDGRSTVKRGEKLPTGTYFYILRYNNNGNGVEKSGYLYINNQ
ncbi:gliding motility-associated C-terminal domain-containing protein [Flavobacterium aquidurense]|uniref:CHU C domain containing protein n=1 Tax=Flavobacterium aquidurense TaxID=362413 RepID=A0A0Q0S3R5_9FLAO|nr:gliding motility-associated C-terminal domain-containing protein [Flavobacterium aquidurense]KQB40120.1 CHU C domain containing protein [Flavobacterium aquidurense]